jgi:hypothetical protein
LLNEQTARDGMKRDRGTEKAREQGCECINGNQATVILEEEWCGQIKVAATDPRLVVVIGELCVDVVEAELPALPFGFGGNAAERLEDFEEPDVVAAGMFDEVERVGGRRGIDGDAFVGRSAMEPDSTQKGKQ